MSVIQNLEVCVREKLFGPWSHDRRRTTLPRPAMWRRSLASAAATAFGSPLFGLRMMTNGGGNRWNSVSPGGWRYARDMKGKQGQNYLSKQARARMEGRVKGTLGPALLWTACMNDLRWPPSCAHRRRRTRCVREDPRGPRLEGGGCSRARTTKIGLYARIQSRWSRAGGRGVERDVVLG